MLPVGSVNGSGNASGEGFLLRGGGKNHVFLCKFAVPTEKGVLWAMRLEAFPSCAGMEKRIGMLNIHEN